MQQQLETMVYESSGRVEQNRVYVIGDLEKLSATALYYGTGGGSGSGSGSSGGFGGGFFSGFGGKAPSGGGPKPSISGSTIFKTPYMDACERGPSGGGSKSSLTIRDFPTMQLHIHETDGLITGANIKGKGKKGGKGLELSNYEAAMGDLYADTLGIKKKEKTFLQKLCEEYGIKP